MKLFRFRAENSFLSHSNLNKNFFCSHSNFQMKKNNFMNTVKREQKRMSHAMADNVNAKSNKSVFITPNLHIYV